MLAKENRNKLAGRIALYCTGLALLYSVLNLSQELYESVIYDVSIAVIIFFCYLLNRWKFHKTGKIIGLLSFNMGFLLYACMMPKEVGIYLFYFPLVVVSSTLFGNNEKIFRYFFIGLPLLCLALLFITRFDLIGPYQLKSPVDPEMFFITNVFSCGVIMVICIDFMLKLNESSELELKILADEVRAKNEDLQKTNAELDRFLYSTSHDLRAPLSSIKGLINLARYDTEDKQMHHYFSMMIDRMEKLDHFIKDIIDYSKNARTELLSEPVNFSELLTEIADSMKYIEGADRIEFKSEVDIPYVVMHDKGRLSVILNNLLANAIKYHDLQKDHPWINVRVSNSHNIIKLVVSDNGSGIGMEHQQKIFEMFYRGTLQSKGSGLGLYIVKETVDRMKGTIRVESQEGEGTAFFITLPAYGSDIA